MAHMKVSICIPAYNNVDSLKRCLDSILIQDFDDYEVVVTDDSPSDLVADLVSSYANRKIKYYKNQIPLGSPENWNKALSLATGEYIKIMHHDDWFSENSALRKFVLLLDLNKDVFFAASGCNDVAKEGIIAKRTIRQKDIKGINENPRFLFNGNYLGAPSVTIFRNKKRFSFDKNLVWLVDIDFYIDVLLEYPQLATTTDRLVNIGISQSQITRSCENDTNLILSEYVYLYEKLKSRDQDNHLWKALLKQFAKYRIDTNKEFAEKIKTEGPFLTVSDSIQIRMFVLVNSFVDTGKTIKRFIFNLWK